MASILIVDDERSVASLLSAVFRRAGFAVQTAGSPQEAMRLCQSECFDVVLSDVVMPSMDGHALARWVAGHCPRSRIVLMSGFDPGCDSCPYEEGCPFVSKPVDVKGVVRFVSDLLNTPLPPPSGPTM